MFKFLFIIFFFFLLLLFLMGFSIFRTIKNIFFGGSVGKRPTSGRHSSSSRGTTTNVHDEPRQNTRRKIFAKDEGEYVDYEEVK